MKSLMQSKLAKRLLVLVALTMTLTYLRAPTKAGAVSCQTECALIEDRCLESCGTPPPEGCFDECAVEYHECVAKCN
jgi:hypothetical protein